MKRLICVLSDKGGIGKTVASLCIADVLRNRWNVDTSVYDADGDVGTCVRVLGTRDEAGMLIANQEPKTGCGFFQIRNEDGWSMLLKCVADGAERILVDTAGGSSSYFQNVVDFGNGVSGLLDAYECEGYRPTLIHMLSTDIASIQSIASYYRMFGSRADHVVIQNHLFSLRGSTAERTFTDWYGSNTRQRILECGGIELELPALPKDVLNNVYRLNKSFTPALSDPSISLIDRSLVRSLIKNVEASLSQIKPFLGVQS